MGTWGYRNFENDTAADWLSDWQEDPDLEKIGDTLDELLSNTSNPGSDLCHEALAAAELVAAMKGKPAKDLNNTAREQVEELATTPVFIEELRQKSLIVIEIVKVDSDLQEAWGEVEELEEWHAILRDLKKRLS